MKVVELVGPQTLCRVVYHLHSTVVSCFPLDEPDCLSEEKMQVLRESVRDVRFLQSLDMSDRDFDRLLPDFECDLRRSALPRLAQESTRVCVSAAAGGTSHCKPGS